MSMPTAADVCACTLRRLDIADGVTLVSFRFDFDRWTAWTGVERAELREMRDLP